MSVKFTGYFLCVLLLGISISSCKKDGNANNFVPEMKAITPGLQENSLYNFAINGDGRFIVFSTSVSLSAADTDNFYDVYRYDRNDNSITLISTNLVSNSFGVSISDDGSRILYTASQLASQAQYPTAIYLWSNGNIAAMQEGTQDPYFPYPFMTPQVAFTNIISPDGNRIAVNVNLNHFVYDITTQTSTLVGNGQPSDFSKDGRFHTWIDVDVLTPGKSPSNWLYDRTTGSSIPLGNDTKYSGEPRVNGDGTLVVFESELGSLTGAEDNNGLQDVFLMNLSIPKYTRLVGANANAESGYPDISEDGNIIVFASNANTLGLPDNNLFTDIIIQINGQQSNITPDGNNHSTLPRLSSDGKWVAFVSGATNLQNGTAVPNLYIAGPLR